MYRPLLYRPLLLSAALIFVTSAQVGLLAQSNATTALSGTVADPSGAVIANATVVLLPQDAAQSAVTARTDAAGHFGISLGPGTYDLSIDTAGFTFYQQSIVIGDKPQRLSIKLKIASQAEEVDVAPDAESTSSGNNKSALTLKGSDLEALSNDDSTFKQEVLAMAGGSGGSQIYVDGFSNGSFPPKDSIREIRINENPFSAQYEDLGYGRVEISTKPGTDKLRASFYSSGNLDTLNARNPFTGAEPPYYSIITGGDVSGPLGKSTSIFFSGRYNNIQGNAIVNAFNPDGSPLSQAVPSPDVNEDFTLRLDRQLSKNNTLVARYEYNNDTASNSGVGLLVLPSEGVSTSTTTQTLQIGNTQVIGPKLISETRFQYLRTRTSQTPNSTAPTIVVQGSFNGGGSPSGNFEDKQDRYEFQQYLSWSHGKHFLRTGVRYRLLRDSNRSNANYNGQFTFTGLAAYQANTPSLFSITAGQPSAVILNGDLGAYAEDEWKVRQNVTLDYGLRIESQTGIPDHFDPAPRVTASWAVGQTPKHPPLVVIRASGGLFYTRFAAGNILTSVRQNGISQQSYLVNNPDFYPTIPVISQLSNTPPTPYNISPHLHISSEAIGSISAERTIGKIGSLSATWYPVRGVHQYNSFNTNAPLPGTYDPNNPASSGDRPMGGTQNVYQFASEGIAKSQAFVINGNLHPGKKLFLFFYYGTRHEMADSFGAGTFPSHPYNLSADYGPSGLGQHAIAQRLFTGVNYKLPFGLSTELFFAAFSRDRFDITTGADLNGDTQYNDRPAFATSPGPTSILYKTPFGNFDANPQPGETIIPYNYGRAPRVVFTELSLSRSFKFGPRPEMPAPPAGTPAPKGPVPKPDPKYDLSFSIDGSNIFNHVNGGPSGRRVDLTLFREVDLVESFFCLLGGIEPHGLPANLFSVLG